jgi:hypothetical protein
MTRARLHRALVGILAGALDPRETTPMAGCPLCGAHEVVGLGLRGDTGPAWPWCYGCGLAGEPWVEHARAAVVRVGGRWPFPAGVTVAEHAALRADLNAFWHSTTKEAS